MFMVIVLIFPFSLSVSLFLVPLPLSLHHFPFYKILAPLPRCLSQYRCPSLIFSVLYSSLSSTPVSIPLLLTYLTVFLPFLRPHSPFTFFHLLSTTLLSSLFSPPAPHHSPPLSVCLTSGWPESDPHSSGSPF